jgi:phospholipid/cholesterol/gamma-HCH transport system ATP-binding protein
VIEIDDLWKSFGDNQVLKGITLAIPRGETFVVLGGSGSGKTVLMKHVIGLLKPDRGAVRVGGHEMSTLEGKALNEARQLFGMVFQGAALFDSMTVFENVSQGLPDDVLKGLDQREVLRRVCRSLEEVNLEPSQILGKLPAELSGGMRKRVGLARAIVGEPQILLYDEPVTGLDPINTAGIDKLITDIAARSHVTSIVVTHDIEGALMICDRIALLEGGRLHFIGTPEGFRHSDVPLVQAFADRTAAAAAARDMETVMRGPARGSATEERHP